MGTDTEWASSATANSGEDSTDREEHDVERMLIGFLRALLDESRETKN